ncbi:MAG TPA: hypothetical protein VN958_06350 [Chitinophagaceae bacterium]|nr:hypothetical protein [Chitinophagaceae bacterium]
MKKNKFLLGVILGIVSPMLGIIVFYFWKAPSARFSYFLEVMVNNKSLLTAAISFSLLMNAIVFTWCVNTRKDKTARGVFLVTLIITIPAIIYKLFFR